MATQSTFSFSQSDPAPSGETGCEEMLGRKEEAGREGAGFEGAGRDETMRRLRAELGRNVSGVAVSSDVSEGPERLSTGCRPFDALLPHGGLRTDALCEWVADGEGAGGVGGAAAVSLAILARRWRVVSEDSADASRAKGGPLVVVDPDETFYPPAGVAMGIPADQIVWCRPRSRPDTVWAIDQALRCRSVAAVWAYVGDWLDDRDARRFQLAAEAGKTPGWLIRPATVRGRPSFAETRFHVAIPADGCSHEAVRLHESVRLHGSVGLNGSAGLYEAAGPWPIEVTLARVRGGTAGGSVRVWVDDQGHLRHETAAMHLASRLADPSLGATRPAAAGRRRA